MPPRVNSYSTDYAYSTHRMVRLAAAFTASCAEAADAAAAAGQQYRQPSRRSERLAPRWTPGGRWMGRRGKERSARGRRLPGRSPAEHSPPTAMRCSCSSSSSCLHTSAAYTWGFTPQRNIVRPQTVIALPTSPHLTLPCRLCRPTYTYRTTIPL